jgi:lipid-binding SYLF domain-containing protein
MRTALATVALAAVVALIGGCSTAPKTPEQKRSLVAEADAAVSTMTAKDPSLRDLINNSAYGYAVFPDVGKAGAIVGGAYGRGVVYEQGRPVGFTELNQASIGAQLGGQSYSELVVFENEAALNRLKAGNFDFGAEVSAVAIKAGGAGAARFEGGVAVFQLPKGGLMAAAAINGQKLNYQPMDSSTVAGDRATTRSATTRTSDEMQLRTERTTETMTDRANTAADTTPSATDRTEQRIEQRRQETQQQAPGSGR